LDILQVPCLHIYAMMLSAVKCSHVCQTNTSLHGTHTSQQNKLHIPVVGLSSIQYREVTTNLLKYKTSFHTIYLHFTIYIFSIFCYGFTWLKCPLLHHGICLLILTLLNFTIQIHEHSYSYFLHYSVMHMVL
jgi:hypothetical protein